VGYLGSLLNNTATMTVLCYALFTVTSRKNPTLIITLPIVYYAILYYQHIIIVREEGEEPDKILFKERCIPILILLWLVTYLAVSYWDLHLLR
jgi:hypothetical protein